MLLGNTTRSTTGTALLCILSHAPELALLLALGWKFWPPGIPPFFGNISVVD